ncbi:efflux RND transporter periplasmic adaptor subunit [Bacteroidaceae bacterium HV4-6-C5C]|nr:efflux RND transporter periplasmic adaptor subunit [Bacteroidaceae bacterium HV4-6-C5C]
MKKNSYVFLCLWAGLLMTGCGKKQEKETINPLPVKVITVKVENWDAERDFSGTTEEMSGTSLSFSIGGTLKKILVSTGKNIHKGELIAIADDATLRNAYNIAAATLNQAKDSYQRMKLLHDKGSLPEMQWVEVQSKLEQASASEKIARKDMQDCKLYAPFSGVISEKFADAGENVMPGSPIVKLVTINQIKIKIAVPENEISGINIGQTLKLIVPALNSQDFEGKVIEKGISANPLSRSYEVKAIVDNPNGKLMPGMVCQVKVNLNKKGNSMLMLPTQLIQLDENNHSFIWIVKEGKAQRRFIQWKGFSDKNTIINSGLESGDQVIVEGQQKVSENTPVNIIK